LSQLIQDKKKQITTDKGCYVIYYILYGCLETSFFQAFSI